MGQGDDWSIQLSEIGGVDTFDSATIGTSPTVVTTTTNQHEFPEYILVVSLWPTGSGRPGAEYPALDGPECSCHAYRVHAEQCDVLRAPGGQVDASCSALA